MLISKQDLVDRYGLPTEYANVQDQRLDDPMAAAEATLRQHLTDTVYDNTLTLSDQAELTTDERLQVSLVTRAEALLVLANGLPDWNLKVLEQGGVIMSTGFEDSRQEFATAREVDVMADKMYHRAINLVEPYRPAPDTTTDETADDILNAGDFQIAAV